MVEYNDEIMKVQQAHSVSESGGDEPDAQMEDLWDCEKCG